MTTDADEVYNAFLNLNTKEMKKALTAGLKKGLTAVRNESRRYLKSWYPNAAKNNSKKWDNSLTNDIRLSKIFENEHLFSGLVLATSKRNNSKSGAFRLKFFESGTAVRKTRKGYNRGSINGVSFMKNAAEESYFNQTMEEAFSEAVRKINNTKWK